MSLDAFELVFKKMMFYFSVLSASINKGMVVPMFMAIINVDIIHE